MQNGASRRINGAALEMIMQDVLEGMQDFTSVVCCGSETTAMEIIAVEKADHSQPGKAEIIPFPVPQGK
mgnify:CR=1 FL=1